MSIEHCKKCNQKVDTDVDVDHDADCEDPDKELKEGLSAI